MQCWLLTVLKAVLAPQDVCAGVDEPVPWWGDHSPAQTCQEEGKSVLRVNRPGKAIRTWYPCNYKPANWYLFF